MLNPLSITSKINFYDVRVIKNFTYIIYHFAISIILNTFASPIIIIDARNTTEVFVIAPPFEPSTTYCISYIYDNYCYSSSAPPGLYRPYMAKCFQRHIRRHRVFLFFVFAHRARRFSQKRHSRHSPRQQ